MLVGNVFSLQKEQRFVSVVKLGLKGIPHFTWLLLEHPPSKPLAGAAFPSTSTSKGDHP